MVFLCVVWSVIQRSYFLFAIEYNGLQCLVFLGVAWSVKRRSCLLFAINKLEEAERSVPLLAGSQWERRRTWKNSQNPTLH